MIVAAIRKLLAAGMDIETALMAAEAFESELPAAAPALTPRQARNRRYYASKKEGGDTRLEASETSEIKTPKTLSDATEKEGSPTPPQENTPFPPLKGGTSPADPVVQAADTQPEKPNSEFDIVLSAAVRSIWDQTPVRARRRSSQAQLARALKAAKGRGHKPGSVTVGVLEYYRSDDATRDDGRFAKGVHRVVQTDLWQSFVPSAEPSSKATEVAESPWPRRLREYRANGYWNTTDWGPKPGKAGCEVPADLMPEAPS